MPNSTKEIKRRIRSINNIGQITKAMELVSAAKMRKAQAAALASRPYAKLASSIVENLAAKVDPSLHRLFSYALPKEQSRKNKLLLILVTPDKGLAGALNSNVINTAFKIIKETGKEKIDVVVIGKKAEDFVKRVGLNVVAVYPSEENVKMSHYSGIMAVAVSGFFEIYSKVFIVYTEFISTLNQKPKILQLLPLTLTTDPGSQEFLFEPNPDDVLDNLLERMINFAIYQTLVEAKASEHSARMVAMRNANEASGDLLDELSLSYNQARQAGITRELSEISAAKLAMENN